MSKKKYLKISIVYIAGAALLLTGVYFFLDSMGVVNGTKTPDMTANSFYIMLAGLTVSGIGSRYGHKKLRDPEFMKEIEAAEKERLKNDAEKKKLEEQKKKEEELKAQKEAADKKVEFTGTEKGVAKSEKEVVAEASPVESGQNVKVVKILLCPSCGEDNKLTAYFSDKCGKKLRPGRASK